MHKEFKIKRKRLFTLVELMVSMFLFLIIMGIVARYFAAANQVWRVTARKNEVYASARVALDLIARDVQCAMYNNDWTVPGRGLYPFFHFAPGTATTVSTSEQLCMITQTPLKPRDATTNICEVRYSRYRDSNDYTNEGATVIAKEVRRKNEFWLIRSCTGNIDSAGVNAHYNFATFPIVDSGGWRTAAELQGIFSDTNSDHWQKVIPNVIDLRFECYKKDLTLSLEAALTSGTVTGSGSSFPARVKIIITILDEGSMAKYRVLRDRSDPAEHQFLLDHQLSFSRTVYMNSRESF